MFIEEKEKLYFIGKRIDNVKSVLKILKSELSNENGALSNETINGALSCVIDSLNSVSKDCK